MTPDTAPVQTGVTPINVPEVLRRAWVRPFATRSDFARAHADSVAAAASLGYLTTQVGPALFERVWLITPAGLAHLWSINNLED